jgi:hypothetical protein
MKRPTTDKYLTFKLQAYSNYKPFEIPPIPEIKIWFLVELFLSAYSYYEKNIYLNYEKRVNHLSKIMDKDRRELRLDVDELDILIDKTELEFLRTEILAPLRDLSHEIFREEDTFEPFDTYISAIFHEISILKEVNLQLSPLAKAFKDFDPEEITSILDEVHEQFPQKTQHVQKIFNKALERLKKILPFYHKNAFLLRSAFLENENVFKNSFFSLEEFYSILFKGKSAWGYYYTAKSFLDSAFYQLCSQCYQLAYKKMEKEDQELLRALEELKKILDQQSLQEASQEIPTQRILR